MKFKLEKADYRKFVADYWPWFIIFPVMIGFFIFTSSFNYLTQDHIFIKWLSPDETANYYSAKTYATTGSLAWFEKYNLLVKDIIHPRSFRSDWGLMKPVSFLGLPIIYGTLADIFGINILPYLTPLFGALGLAFFYLLIKKVFDKEVALISVLLASVFPIYTYFTARSMFHNVLFLSSLVAGFYFAVNMTKVRYQSTNYFKRHSLGWLFSFLAGLLIGIALVTRTSELLWLGPMLIFLWIFNIRKLGFTRLVVFVYGIFVAFLPVMYWNNLLYGSFFSSGYPELNTSVLSLTKDSSALATDLVVGKIYNLKTTVISILKTVFHFGFNIGQSYKMFNDYVINMFSWLFWTAGFGIIFFLLYIKEYKKSRWLFLLSWLGISFVLVVYYGSWVFFDNPDKTSTIGNSYTRYWLPFYFGALPFVGLALVRVTNIFKHPAAIWSSRMVVITIIAVLSLQYVWFEPNEGLKISIDKQQASRQELSEVLKLTPKNAAIITRYHDKLLFPERRVIIGLFDDKNMINEYSVLARKIPVYYYNFSFKDEDIKYLNNGPLKERGIAMDLVKNITARFSLYKLNPIITVENKELEINKK